MQQALALFDEIPSVEVLISKREDQWFDRKSFRIEAVNLGDSLVAFANADGGRIAVGIHNGKVEGVDSNINHLNELLQAAINFTNPPIRYRDSYVDCINKDGNPDRVLLLDIEASERIHRNHRGECFLRVGDEKRKLSSTEERELAFDKGESVFDGTLVKGLGREDLDALSIAEYVKKVAGTDPARILHSRGLYLESQYFAWCNARRLAVVWEDPAYLVVYPLFTLRWSCCGDGNTL